MGLTNIDFTVKKIIIQRYTIHNTHHYSYCVQTLLQNVVLQTVDTSGDQNSAEPKRGEPFVTPAFLIFHLFVIFLRTQYYERVK